jgi:Protein of unknown function (DUF3341)
MSEASQKLHGVVAEFETPEELLEAALKTTSAGYTRAEAYTPFPIDGLADALNFHHTPIAAMACIAGILGGLTGFGMCWYANVLNYPLNIGGRPHNSWPAWIPITFELTVLFAALTAAIGMLYLNGLPRLHHPIFNTPNFNRATHDRFFLCIEATDPQFDPPAVHEFLKSLHPLAIEEVPE